MKFGFIGCGNMGGALARAVCKSVGAEQVMITNRTIAKADALAEQLGCKVSTNAEIAETCDFIFLGVKPQMMRDMLSGITEIFKNREKPAILVSMAAGLTTDTICEMSVDGPVIRIMPNTPASIGVGMIQYCAKNVSQADMEIFLDAMKPAGLMDELPEHLIDAASAVSGCGPAYAYIFIEALADAGVACGLPRAKAMKYAAQMLFGSAQMVLESGEHPGALKDAVCSPGGSTIQGVMKLEQGGFRAAVENAVVAACEKSKKLGKK